ncbi:globin-coupled sensor protein [Paenibacillus glacialis]|uniref:Chemotaxis protein n=1 Tax=Paenibacillus glacialis TaxID=494026 RepID=A0A168FAR1_9BACL|nr:globin-coupled sensor protein [Paenibacillus glacialis]OAB36021.1 chemotaxis protein [Paenibacillus glacialis]
MIQVTESRKKQLDYTGITEADLTYLSEQKEYFEAITDIVVDHLYDHIYEQPELVAIITKNSTIDRLKKTQRWYFMTMVDGHIDMDFIEKRLAIGKVHSRIGLTTNWYLGTYMTYLDISIQCLKKVAPEQWMTIMLSLAKLFNFDSQLVLESYEQDEKKKVQELFEERQDTLIKVNKAVQELITLMVELSGSSQSITDTAVNTADLQDQAYDKVNLLRSKISEITVVGDLLQEVSDQTHLLGLNAAIEAAHAKEFGRGFGVVADEIRKLASHSKNSLKEIKVTLNEISNVLQEVMKDSERTTLLARAQAASSQELTAFVNMIESVTEQLENIK